MPPNHLAYAAVLAVTGLAALILPWLFPIPGVLQFLIFVVALLGLNL